jgi:hypothetical protein
MNGKYSAGDTRSVFKVLLSICLELKIIPQLNVRSYVVCSKTNKLRKARNFLRPTLIAFRVDLP